jgi:ribulose-phosphate 3-epimerase
LFFDVHLMVAHPVSFLEMFAEAGADQLTVHLEIGREPLEKSLDQIRQLGLAVGLAINPETPVEVSEAYLGKVDEILVMGVHPGFGGQRFLPQIREKILWLSARQKYDRYAIGVDGGVCAENVRSLAVAGANRLIVGSAFFRCSDPKTFVQSLDVHRA